MKKNKIRFYQRVVSFREVFGNGVIYRVPRFQRNYAWEKEQWDDLWQDIESLMESDDDSRYLGYIVLCAESDTLFQVIDGQQRLATLSIFALAIVALLDELIAAGGDDIENNKKRREKMKSRFLVVEGMKSLSEENRLQLGFDDGDFYRNRLLRLRSPSSVRGLPPSQRKMWQALEFFKGKIREHFDGQPSGGQLAEILDDGGNVSSGLVFTEMTVENEDDAYTIFETLNGRGVELTGSDLVKNFLFRLASEAGDRSDLERLESLWGGAMRALGRGDPMVFLRHFHNSRGKVVTKGRLFREIKDDIGDNGEKVFPFAHDMAEAADEYKILQDPNAAEWKGKESLARYLRHLEIYGVSSPLPLLLAAYRKWGGEDDFVRIVRNCAALSFRHAVIGHENPKDLERDYAEAAGIITRGDARDAGDVLPVLERHFPNDEKFKVDFRYADVQKKKVIMHVLFELERQAGNSVAFDADSPKHTVEHVLPQNPGEGWGEFEKHAAYLWRLGNLAILTKDQQREAGNRPFAGKLDVYCRSDFRLTKELADYDEWTPDSVGRRQTEMARYAAAIWKLS